MRFDKLTQTIAAGAVWRLGMTAAELQIVASSYPLRVTLYRAGAVIGSGSNVLAGDYFRGVDFDAVELFSADAQEVTILLSDGESGSSRIVGEVSVINGAVQSVKSGVCFVGAGFQGAATGAYSCVQLLNKAGSGKRVILSKVNILSSASVIAAIRMFDPPLLSLFGPGYSKFLGGGDSTAVEIRNEARPTDSDGVGLMNQGVIANDGREVPFSEPLVLSPGKGIIVLSVAVAVDLRTDFQWQEETI